MKSGTLPRYQQLKELIIEKISRGDLKPDDRVPSENELVDATGVSRMTANRALRELNDEGYVNRVAGVGTFVADFRAASDPLQVRNIADEIALRGHQHNAQLLEKAALQAEQDVAAALEIDANENVFHLRLVHFENAVAIQLEDRYVLPEFAPDILAQDFCDETPSAYLSSIAPLQEAEHVVTAELPAVEIRDCLDMQDHEPCLVVTRRTWAVRQTGYVCTSLSSRQPLRAVRPVLTTLCGIAQAGAQKRRIGTMTHARTVRAATGTTLQAKSWLTEAPLRMIMNNLDPEVAERPEDLVVYGGIGKAARNWDCFDAIVAKLKELESDETCSCSPANRSACFAHTKTPRVC